MKSFKKSLAIAVGGLCALPAAAHGKEVKNASPSGMAMMRLNAAELTVNDPHSYAAANHGTARQIYGGSVWNSLKSDFRMREVNPSLVRSHENKFVANSAYFNRTIDRSKPYMFHITNEVKKRGMPAEVALLPFIESAYVTKAKSRVGASGLWQFMPATGRHYGLEQTPLYDGRHDVYAATDAALNYLQYLHRLFGDWSLALAAYNWGEGNVSRAVRQAQAAGIAPTYENLRMPSETRNYVPKLLAVRNLVNNPQAYGINLPEIQNTPYFTPVSVNAPMDIMAAAHLANISESEFLALNPGFKTPVFIPKNGRKMLLPITAAKTFETNYRNADSRALLSWDVFTPSYQMTISDVAAQTNTPVGELRRLNGLNGSKVAAGKTILVSRNGSPNSQNITLNFAKADNDPVPDTYVEQAPVLNMAVATPPRTETPQRQKQADFINFIENNQIASAAKLPEPQTVSAPVVAKAAAAASETASAQNVLAGAFTAESQNTPTLDNVQAAAASSPVAASGDPLMNLASEQLNLAGARQRALQATRATVAQANREEAARERAERAARAAAERAAKLAEAKEAKRREQERLRAEKMEQAQQLASIRQARENGNSVAQAIRTSAKLPQHGGTHKVQEGDTLFNIAQRYNLNVADLVSSNNIRNNHIRIGQVLKLSGGKKGATPAVQRNPLQKVSGKQQSAQNTTPASYTVRKGDTLHSIASRFNLNVNEIKKLNNGNANLKTGQTIKLISS